MNEILEKIKSYDTILIHRHKNPDPDAYGSQCGLRAILRAHFPEKKIYAVGYDEPTLTYLAEMDQVELAAHTHYLSIVCDTANTPRIDDSRWEQADFLIKIDHHPNDDAYGDLQLVEPERSSASEMVTDFATETGLTLNAEAARLLYAGIVGDTGRFLYPATSSHTFSVAAILADYDFDRAALGREMASFDRKLVKIHAYLYENLEITDSGAAQITLTQEQLREFGISIAETSMLVSIPGNIREVKAWILFVEMANGNYRVHFRSKTTVVNEIAKRHDGGGHIYASGATSYSLMENQEIWEELKAAVN